MEIDYTPRIMGWVKGTSCHYPITQNGSTGEPFCCCKGYEYRKKCRHLDMFNKGEFSVEMQFNVTFKRGQVIVVTIEGERLLNGDDLTLEEASQKVLRTEAFLEKLTGLRVHIEQVI